MHVSLESAEATESRLRTVLREAELETFTGLWQFEEFHDADFAACVRPDALALVRDGACWSQLVPATERTSESMVLWSVHFRAGVDNSGFVGWLASHVKTETGSGVAVVCGQNSGRGGIFDYWCCPAEAASSIHSLIQRLRSA